MKKKAPNILHWQGLHSIFLVVTYIVQKREGRPDLHSVCLKLAIYNTIE